MANIVFVCDMEEGHILPTFGLARSLQQRGHNIIYLSVCDNEEIVTAQGFSFHASLAELLPKGSRQKIKQSMMLSGGADDFETSRLRKLESEQFLNDLRRTHIDQMINGAYDSFLHEIRPDVVIVNIFLPFQVLILFYKYKIRPVILTPHLKEPGQSIAEKCIDFIEGLTPEEKYMLVDFLTDTDINFSSFKEITAPLNTLTELVLCPAELNIDQALMTPYIRYIEPSIRNEELNGDIYSLYGVPIGKKIIYASMGSQAIRHGINCELFYTKIISVLGEPEFSDLHLIICVDKEFDKRKLGLVGKNVTIVPWAPQIDILRVASLAIIHGGLGSVKECIYYGVPMIVFPQGYDQPMNAKRVAHHKLGYMGNIQTITLSDLKSYIPKALYDDQIKIAVQKMKMIFVDKEKAQTGANIIEQLMTDKSPDLLRSK